MRRITSYANAAVRRARRLLRKKGRDRDDAFLIEGAVLIGDAVRAGIVVEQIFIRGDAADDETAQAPELPEPLPLGGVETAVLSEKVFDGIADTVTSKGVIAVARKPLWPETAWGDALLVLDRLQDPGNVGALIRAAEAIGFDSIVCVKGTADPFSPKAVRAAAGSLFRIPVHEPGGPEEALAVLKSGSYRIVTLDARGPSLCWEADLTGHAAFVVGNEGGGAAACFQEAADISVRAPMTAGAESLNAAVAAGIAMYERIRQESAAEAIK